MNKHFKSILMLALVAATLYSCKKKAEKNKEEDATAQSEEHHGLDLQYMDTTVDPAQNFYKFVNGKWMEETQIPSDRKSWGSFNQLRKNTDYDVLAMLSEAMENDEFETGTDQAKAVTLFKSELDTAARNEAGLAPLKPIMQKISAVKDLDGLQKLMREYPIQVGNPFFGVYAMANFNNSAMNSAYLVNGSLGLPDRAYYTKDDDKSKKIRQQYVDHITRMFKLWGLDAEVAKQKAETILALETKLAKPRLTKEERRDVRKLNNPRSMKQIAEMLPTVDWDKLLASLPTDAEVDTMLVTQPQYIKSLQELLTSTDIEDLKTLVSWTTLNGAAGDLTTKMEKANWEFYSKTLNGVPEMRPAKERALSTVNGTIGMAVGKIYVEQKFPPEAKETAENMVHNIIATFEDRIKKLDWMSDSTKQKAIEKLNKLTIKIGYPDNWEDYSAMDINPENSYYENLMAAAKWHYKDNLSKINKPVDEKEWHMNPQTVNAYYNPSMNEIVFPAAILQPPFFDYQADPAVNYGGIGAVIGHEISHAFDDSGSRFDAEGNVSNWWTKEDLKQFQKRTQELKDFYNKVEVKEGLHLNGDYTVGENGADLGGILAAFNGMKRYYKSHEKPGKIAGFTQPQRFFISWATVWRTKTRPEALVTQIKTDPHSPGQYRAYLPLLNVDAFYKAFDVQPGDSLYVAPEDRVRIW